MLFALGAIALLSSIVSAQDSIQVFIPPNKTMESIRHIGRGNFIMSDFVTGNVMMLDANAELVTTIVQAPEGRSIQGLAYHEEKKLIIAAGSGTTVGETFNIVLGLFGNSLGIEFPVNPPGMYFYDIETGLEFATCVPDNAINVNDVTLDDKGEYAYFTESTGDPVIWKVSIDALPECEIEEIPLPEDTFSVDGLNLKGAGIVYYKGGLIVSNYAFESLYWVDLKNDNAASIIVPEEAYGDMDGLRLYGSCLFGAFFEGNAIQVFKVSMDKATREVTADFAMSITDPLISFPSSLDFKGNTMVVSCLDMQLLGNETGQLYVNVIEVPAGARKLCET